MKRTRVTCSGLSFVRMAWLFAVVVVGLGSACWRPVEHTDPAVETPQAHTPRVVLRRVDGAPRDAPEMVAWALDRFAQAGLRLPDRIVVTFDVTRQACHETPGCCHPDMDIPEAIVCEPDGTSAFRVMNRQITLLHELAHIWHWHQSNGWSDESPTVGGSFADDEADWSDRMVERVAVVISWGLLETKRRPVRTDLRCAELYECFERLTGRSPLGELELVCRPDRAHTTTSDP